MLRNYFLLFIFSIVCLCGRAAKKEHILILHSYYPGYPWTDSINKGIMSVLTANGYTNDNLFFEYLDANRHPEKEYMENISNFITTKYSVEHIDLIIISDNQALDFMLTWGDIIFPNIPVAFCGINSFDKKVLIDKPLYTGIAESIALSENIILIKNLIPNTKHIYVIGEVQSITSRLVLNEAKRDFMQFPNIEFHYITNLTLEVLLKKSESFEKNSAILWFPYNKDNTGRSYSYNEILRALSNQSNIPIFSCWDFYLNNGIVGGILASGYMQGKLAAEQAIAIIQGKKPTDIPVIYKHSLYKTILDKRMLERFSIQDLSPNENVLYINEKIIPVVKYKFELITIVIILIIQTIFIIILVIARRKKQFAEQQSKLNQELLSSILNNMPNAIWMYEIQTGIILPFGNKRLLQFKELAYENIFSATQIQTILKKINHQNHTYINNVETILLDDKLYGNTIIEKRIVPIFNNDTIKYLIAIAEDITLRKQNESELLVRDKILKTLIESIETIYKSDEVYPVLEEVVQQLALLTNISHFEINKLDWKTESQPNSRCIYLWNIDGAAIDNSIIQHSLIISQLTNRNLIIVSKNETRSSLLPQNVALILVPIFVNKKLWGYAYIEDKNERQWSSTIIEVIKIVTNSIGISIELKETVHQLTTAKQKAEESDRLKSAFLANMSHEIRTPLNGILGYANLITRKKTSDEKKIQYKDYINKNARQLLNIIDDIIDIAGIENNQLSIFPENICINLLLQSTYQYALNKCNDYDKQAIVIKLNTPLPDDDAFLYTDDTRFNQIINNLVNNAIKFTHSGEIEIGYTIDNNSQFIFYVKDTGIGIPNHLHEVIFERFRQIDDSLARSYGGSGLGLAICKELINKLEGKIWLESTENIGTTFYFTLPNKNQKEQQDQPKSVDDLDNLPIRDWTNKQILVVDDQIQIYQFINELLSQTNIQCTYAASGFEAISLSKATNFDLILMDIQMPDFSGIETTKAIRRIKPHIPIVAQTAFALREEIKQLNEQQFNRIITKPIKPSVLFNILDQLL